MDFSLAVLASIVVVGIAMQWLAWRMRMPSIFLLLLAGFVLGSGTHWLNPDELFGAALFPIISLSVAVILFEGGLSLDIAELRKIGTVVRRLITWGTLVTWAGATWAAVTFLQMDFELALLLGAVLIVTGPTVIIPMLRQIRPKAQVASPIRWEGIVNDPIGAILAVLVFDIMFLSGGDLTWVGVGQEVGKAIIAGGGLGLLCAWILVVVLEKFWVPDFLQSPVTLGLVMVAFSAADAVLPDAGLLAVTVMGSALASQKRVPVERITQFKENLRVLLISGLFVILAARLPLADPVYTDPRSILFVGFLILVIRPAGVFLSTIGTKLTFKERVFISWMAPRGIVAAAVASVFALELHEIGYEGGDRLASIVFMVIIVTVALYGLTAGPLAKWLGVALTKREGLFIVGASPWVVRLAEVLKEKGIPVSLVDSNWNNVRAAKKIGLRADYANVL
ncbi:MAG: sodium:proton antiporter, partial [Gemmatimonadota bacterium]|nr:sodium:proton antiporter [Gemmatimonadota bacterium]